MKDIKLPMSAEDAKSLKLGEMITVSGLLFTGRSRFHIRAIEDDVYPPIDYAEINCFFHVGPVMRKTGSGWEVVSCEPTSSIRFERYGADVVRKFGLRTLIGKTTMGPATARALRETGGVYLSKIGLSGNALRSQVKSVREVYFLDELGKTEATWIYEVDPRPRRHGSTRSITSAPSSSPSTPKGGTTSRSFHRSPRAGCRRSNGSSEYPRITPIPR